MITSVDQIRELLVSGFDNWEKYGEVRVRHYGELTQFNYTNQAMYSGLWTSFEQLCRGLIVNNKTGDVVARPFDKFFNWGEGDRKTDAPLVRVHEKLDGVLGITYYNPSGYLKVATRGSLTSDQAAWATFHINNWLNGHPVKWAGDWPSHWTLMFEIINPDFRIILDYGDTKELILLAARDMHTGEYVSQEDLSDVAEKNGFSTPFCHTFDDVDDLIEITAALDDNAEGFIAEFADGQFFKFKGAAYCELQRLVMNTSPRVLGRAMYENRATELLQRFPDHLKAEIYQTATEMYAKIDTTIARTLAAHAEIPDTGDRKLMALWVQENYPDLEPYIYLVHDGHLGRLRDAIYRKELGVPVQYRRKQ